MYLIFLISYHYWHFLKSQTQLILYLLLHISSIYPNIKLESHRFSRSRLALFHEYADNSTQIVPDMTWSLVNKHDHDVRITRFLVTQMNLFDSNKEDTQLQSLYKMEINTNRLIYTK